MAAMLKGTTVDRARALTIAGVTLGLAAIFGLFLVLTVGGDAPDPLPEERAAMPTAPSQSPVRVPRDARTPDAVRTADQAAPPGAAEDQLRESSRTLSVEDDRGDAVTPPRAKPSPAFPARPDTGAPVDLQTPAPTLASGPAGPVVFCFPDVIPTPDSCADRQTVLSFATEEIGVATEGGAEALTVDLADPAGGPDRTARTCEQFLSLKANDWGALTTAGMRREQKMNRFCGLIAMASRAMPARGGLTALTEDLIEGMAEDDWPTIGEATVTNPLVLDTPGDPRVWFVQADRVEFTIRDVASADFDGDGQAEVLVFIALQAADGTAVAGGYSIAQRDGLTLTLTPADVY